MRRALGLALAFASACSDPQCRDDERLVGAACIDLPRPEPDATVDDGETGSRPDAAMPRDAEPDAAPDTGLPPAPDAGLPPSEPDAALDQDAGQAPDAGQVPDASATQDDASAPDASTCQPSPEICDGKDNDCDSMIDESPPTWYPDCDLDGAPSIENGIVSCSKPTPNDCTSWTDKKPALSDCNDRDRRYSPNVPAFESGNAPNGLEEQSYIGDMDCDGIVERPALWDSYTADAGWETAPSSYADMPVCPLDASACSVTLARSCYQNHEAPGRPLACGNSEITVIGTSDSCFSFDFSVRVICR